MKPQLLFLLLTLTLLVGCKDNSRPDFINLPSGAGQLQTKVNETATTTALPQQQEDYGIVVKKDCFLSKYKGLNKLCNFPVFWKDFGNFLKKWVSYEMLLLVLAVIIVVWVLRKFVLH